MTAMGPDEQLLDCFCAFLQSRVQTQSVELLRRMATEYVKGGDDTLKEFLHLGASLITILPIDHPEDTQRAVAASLLRTKQQDPVDLASTQCSDLFKRLLARVASKNLVVLQRIFDEFCVGKEQRLERFVRDSFQAISIIPVDLTNPHYGQHLSGTVSSTQPPQLSPSGPPESSRTSTKRLKWNEASSAYAQLRVDTTRQEGETIKSPLRKKHKVKEHESVAVSEERQLQIRIQEEVEKVEATEPWKIALSDELKLPFSEQKYPDLAAKLRRFFARHGRAIWERSFWGPLSKVHPNDKVRQRARKHRQSTAVKSFELNVIIPIFEKLGAEFFVTLDQRSRRCEGWWYRPPLVPLLMLYHEKGEPFCFDYLWNQCHDRFPNTGIKDSSQNRFLSYSESMWSRGSATQHILAALGRARKKALRQNREQEQAAAISDDETQNASGQVELTEEYGRSDATDDGDVSDVTC